MQYILSLHVRQIRIAEKKMTELFKTNIQDHFDAIRVKELLLKEFPLASFQFDLMHPNKLLRAEGKNILTGRIVQILKHEGFYCAVAETKIEP
jgi:hypothetical protein